MCNLGVMFHSILRRFFIETERSLHFARIVIVSRLFHSNSPENCKKINCILVEEILFVDFEPFQTATATVVTQIVKALCVNISRQRCDAPRLVHIRIWIVF